MPTYLAPGSYVEELQLGDNSIQPVGTTTTGFVGQAPWSDARLNEPVAIESFPQFCREYYKPGLSSTPLSHAVNGYFLNGGRRCYVVNIGASQDLTGTGGVRAGLDWFATIDEIATVAAPGFTGAAAYESLLTYAENNGCVAVMDGPETVSKLELLTKAATATAPSSAAATSHSSADSDTGLRPRLSKNGCGAFYFPWITVKDPLGPGLVNVPPSGHVAGLFARVDGLVGVWKAPANEQLRGAVNVSQAITRAEQEVLNPAGVNCIRSFNSGIKVWGARTLADLAQWKYLNVRRLFNFVEKSIGQGTEWVVFEPNDQGLWKKIERDVSGFLMFLHRQGALFGRTPQEAFFVNCNERTNTEESINMGYVITEVGLSVVKPAEFVVFRIGQSSRGTKIEAEQ